MRINGKRHLIVVIVVVICALIPHQGCKKKHAQPNIVLIVLDALRADHLPCYGYEKNTAPFISEIAKKSTVFENVFAASSWTAPATASIFTSLYPFQHGVTTGYLASRFLKIKLGRIPLKTQTIPEVLKTQGYRTYGVADNINIGEKIGFSRGFDRFRKFSYKEEHRMNQQLQEWAAEIKAQEKYFLYIHYNDCHAPYHKRAPWYEKRADHCENVMARYDSEIRYVDEKIKQMYRLFGWDKNTLLIITADHGEEFHDHQGWGHGKNLYDEVIRIPLMIQFPGPARIHKRIETNASHMDILPTMLSYLGIKSRALYSGVDLMPLISGEKHTSGERYIFSHLLKHGRQRQGRSKKQKLAFRATIHNQWKTILIDRFQESRKKELYNLAQDGQERVNLFWDNKNLANRLFFKYLNFEKRCKKYKQETSQVTLDKKQLEELKSLGYVK